MSCGCGGSCGCGTADFSNTQVLELASARPLDPRPQLNKRIEALEAAVVAQFRHFSKDERDADAKSGDALPDGSFPIENEEDLKNAIHLVHMAKDEGKAKSHIRSRAAALGLESKIPKDW